MTELKPLLPRWQLEKRSSSGSWSAVVTDEGTSLRVEVAGTQRHIHDARRDCEERARIAAVLIAMALEPPQIGVDGAASRDGDTSSAGGKPPGGGTSRGDVAPPFAASSSGGANAPASNEVPRSISEGDASRVHVAVELSALVSSGLGNASVGPGLGALLALRGARPPWFVRGAMGFVAPEELELEQGRARMTRLPLDVGLGYALTGRGWSLEPAVGVAIDPFFVRGDDLSHSSSALRLDIGPRATLQGTVGSSTVRALASVRAAWFPRNYELMVNPTGSVGSTPNFWLELTLGARFFAY